MTDPQTERTVRVYEGSAWIDDGYEFMGVGESSGWRTISGWGRDGWDLGDWPYVVYQFRDRTVDGKTLYERSCYVEGDITIETFEKPEDRERATDESALFYWRGDPDRHGLREELAAIGADEMRQNEVAWESIPEHLRGPYSPKRHG